MPTMSPYQQYIHKSRYARWLENEKRRETWEETVERYVTFFSQRLPEASRTTKFVAELRASIVNMDVLPSMRSLMTAGKALDKDHCAGYNCAYIAVDDPRSFDEAMYISMCGTGVGFSVERQHVNQLPTIAENMFPTASVIKVKDSKIGWASSFRELLSLLWSGLIPKWDMSAVRPAGSPLKTFGGRASGPAPLDALFRFAIATFKEAAGRKLTSVECHDLMCKIAEVVVSGGVRRSAMLSLSNLSDDRMRNAKNGQWWAENGQRALSNNSVAYTEKPGVGIFMREWMTLYESKSGERGVFNRVAAQQQAKATGRRTWENIEFGTNPCGEIILRPKGFCNLTEVVARMEDTVATLKAKVVMATILGTLQSTLTNFRYLRKEWQRNAEEERLLGVSLTGIMDCPILSRGSPSKIADVLTELKQAAIDTNKEWAEKLGINQSAAITCVKPSGTVSQLVNSSSGIHARFAKYILRAVRGDKRDPISSFMKTVGVPSESDCTKANDVDVFYFPLKSPDTSYTRHDLTAVEQLNLYLTYRRYWCEHNVSCTVYIKETEWLEVASWVFSHFNEVGGVSFLPHTDHIYPQAPYTEISEEDYHKATATFPVINWEHLAQFEDEDRTANVKELACSGGSCELGGDELYRSAVAVAVASV